MFGFKEPSKKYISANVAPWCLSPCICVSVSNNSVEYGWPCKLPGPDNCYKSFWSSSAATPGTYWVFIIGKQIIIECLFSIL